MADFDAYEYLEKTVEETNNRPSKTRDSGRDIDREKGHRRRDERNSGRRSGDRERKRERSRSRDPDRDYRRSRVKKEEPEKQPTPEADPERDQRTVFAYQIPLRAKEREVYEFFSKAGKVRDVRLIMDRNSRRSKGCGYVEFFEVMSVPAAIALSGHPLLGQPVMVKPSEAEKNLVQSSSSGSTAVHERKLYVENLHFNMNELQLRQIFEPFGQIENVQLPVNPDTGHCKGYGFVQFALVECARAAKNLNGKVEIVGRTIKVSEYHPGVQDSGFDHIDDDDDGRLALNGNSRASLMAKLDRSGSGVAMSLVNAPTMSVPPAIVATQVLNSESIGSPSECLLLRNMFDPVSTRESNPEFVLDIGEDVSEECSRYGAVKHVYVDGDSCGGYVYLRFVSVEAAARAQQALHNRWFASRQISAIFLQPYEYDAKFRA